MNGVGFSLFSSVASESSAFWIFLCAAGREPHGGERICSGPMAIIVFQHTPTEHAGRLGVTLRDHGKLLDVRRLDLPVGGPLRNQHVPLDFDGVEGVISMGGAMNVDEMLPWIKPEMDFLKEANRRNLPVVGVCLGAQLIAKALGGEVGKMDNDGAEWGIAPVKQFPVANTDTILAGVPWTAWEFHAHGYEVKTLPPGATALQYSTRCKVQSFRTGMRTYGFQYHFECDLPMIESFFRPDEALMKRAGVTVEDGVAAARREYQEYGRIGERLCVNLATYLFSVSRKIVA